jgi:DNA-binding SARP family transcriptional activator
VEFRLFGAFDVWTGGGILAVRSPKHRILLATLLLKAGSPVPVADLIDAIRGDAPPSNARKAL